MAIPSIIDVYILKEKIFKI